MAKYAIISGGEVSNIVNADADFAALHGWVEATEGAEIGGTYNGGVFSPKPQPEPVPEVVTVVSRLQFATALALEGVIPATEAEAWAGGNAIPQIAADAIEQSNISDTEKMAARIRAIGATEIPRASSLVAMLQTHPEVNMTDAQADALFALAASLTE